MLKPTVSMATASGAGRILVEQHGEDGFATDKSTHHAFFNFHFGTTFESGKLLQQCSASWIGLGSQVLCNFLNFPSKVFNQIGMILKINDNPALILPFCMKTGLFERLLGCLLCSWLWISTSMRRVCTLSGAIPKPVLSNPTDMRHGPSILSSAG